MLQKKILIDSLFGTLFIFGLLLIFELVRMLGQFSVIDPIGDAIGDVEFTDLVFSELRQDPPVDTSIVLVNIGNLGRRDIARQLMIINELKPAVVGIDGFFFEPKADSLGDMLLAHALSSIPSLVMVSKLTYHEGHQAYDSVRFSHHMFRYGSTGFANVVSEAQEQHQFKVTRTFAPKVDLGPSEEIAFAVRLAQQYNPEAAEAMLARNNAYETINYRGNIYDFGQSQYSGRYFALDVEDVLSRNFAPEIITNRIVIFGYMGDSFNDPSWEDKFYTPLNKKYAGRSNPDMFGVVVHANIVSMILNRDFINCQSKASGIIWAIIICFINVYAFTAIYQRLPQWYDGITKTVQLLEVLLILTFNVLVFHFFGYKTNLVLAAIAVALAGDSLEVCYGLVKNLFSKEGRQSIFKVHREKKLTLS